MALILTRASAALPGITGRVVSADGEEVLAKQPAETGPFWWIKVRKDRIGTTQVRQALARSVNVAVELVSDAGNRDRDGVFSQWFSIPAEAVDHEGPLRRAGAHGKMRVEKLTRSHKPVTTATIARLRWSLRIAKGNENDGYLKAKAIIDALRLSGVPNYAPAARQGPDGQWADWGRQLLLKGRLPAQVRSGGEASHGACLRAVQEQLCDRWISTRLDDGLLAEVVPGDLLLTSTGQIVGTDDLEHCRKRVESWESVVLAPLFGNDMRPASDEALAREAALIKIAGFTPEQLATLHGGRRPARFQPQKTVLDLNGTDLLVTAEMPVDAHVGALVDELLR